MKKIMLIVPSLIRGGAERVVSILSKEFSKYYQVFVVIYHGPIEYEINGKLVNLKTPTGSFLRKIKNTFQRVRKLKKLIVELNLKKQVLLYGKTDNPFIYMKHAIFFVLSSRFEGFGNVIIEALACDTPVIACNCESGPSEIIENGKNGLLVPVEDVESLKMAMNKLFYDKELYVNIKANARRSVKKYDIKNIVQDWIKLF